MLTWVLLEQHLSQHQLRPRLVCRTCVAGLRAWRSRGSWTTTWRASNALREQDRSSPARRHSTRAFALASSGIVSGRVGLGSACCRGLSGRTGTPTRRQLEIAALRRAGPGSALTGDRGVTPYGVRVPEHSLLTVLVPPRPDAGSDHAFVRVWPTTRMPEYVLADGRCGSRWPPGRWPTRAGRLGSCGRCGRSLPATVQRDWCRLADLWPGTGPGRRGGTRAGCGRRWTRWRTGCGRWPRGICVT